MGFVGKNAKYIFKMASPEALNKKSFSLECTLHSPKKTYKDTGAAIKTLQKAAKTFKKSLFPIENPQKTSENPQKLSEIPRRVRKVPKNLTI